LPTIESFTVVVDGASEKVPLVFVSYGSIHLAEVHWYEASGIGKFEFKIKQFL